MTHIKYFLRNAGIAIMLLACAITADAVRHNTAGRPLTSLAEAALSSGPTIKPTFHYNFAVDGTLYETGSMEKSTSPYFWVNSGGSLILKGGLGSTVRDALPLGNIWQLAYAKSNPLDTEGGLRPQNIFRLVTKDTWKNVEQTVRFKIDDINRTDTPNRDGWSGILLMSRYQDGDNLYYAGIRMDGGAVIKKKYKGTYYTLASAQIFGTANEYNRTTNPNLIPEDVWMGLRSVVADQADGSVRIELWLDRDNSQTWKRIAVATDKAGTNGSGVIKGEAHAGIRTDYMDAYFDNYELKAL